MDSRAWGLKDYGMQPFIGKELNKTREINEIILNQTKGKSPDERVPDYKKRFTPITTYMKSLKDSQVTPQYGSYYSQYRSNLNKS